MKGRLMVCPGEVRLTVHPPISTETVQRREVIEFGDRVRAIVVRGVDEQEAAARNVSSSEVR
jgi:hypothetical protein